MRTLSSTVFSVLLLCTLTSMATAQTPVFKIEDSDGTTLLLVNDDGTLTLPGAGTATNGYVLTTDATGNATWQAAPTGGGTLTLPFSGTTATSGPAFSVENTDNAGASSAIEAVASTGSAKGLTVAAGGEGIRVSSAGTRGAFVLSSGDEAFGAQFAGGDGVKIFRAGSPTSTSSSSLANGFEVAGAGGYGLFVGHADRDGIVIETAGSPSASFFSQETNGVEVQGADDYGLYVGRADDSGIYVRSTGADGVEVQSASVDGVRVRAAADDGLSVLTAGTPSDFTGSGESNGVEVQGAEGDGVFVGRADRNGLTVDRAGADGVLVTEAGTPSTTTTLSQNNGVEVGGAEGSGIAVGRADLNGLFVSSAGLYGVSVASSESDGVRVSSAGRFGVYVGSSNADGIRIDAAGGDGLEVNSASGADGVRVNDAARYAGNFNNNSDNATLRARQNGTGDLLHALAGTNLRFAVRNNGDVNADGTFTSPAADLAEAFAVVGPKADYEPGDVLVISAHTDRTVEQSTEAYSTRVVGVYATKPGVLLGKRDDDLTDKVPMGVVGVIPTKVSAENGPIRRGDLLVTAHTPGHAMKADPDVLRFGMVLGKALAPFDGPGTGVIEVLVNVK